MKQLWKIYWEEKHGISPTESFGNQPWKGALLAGNRTQFFGSANRRTIAGGYSSKPGLITKGCSSKKHQGANHRNGCQTKNWPFFVAADNQELLDVYLAPLSKAGLPPLALQEDEEAGLGISGRPVGLSNFLHLLRGVLLWQTHLTKMGCWKNNMLIQTITMRYWGFLPIWGTELTRIQHLGNNKLLVLFKQQNKG